MSEHKPILLTGDTPTGKLHLGHYVGTLENRVKLQNENLYECLFIIANVHAFTNRFDKPEQIYRNTIDVAMDYLAVGIDPSLSKIFIQSEVPAISELTFLFSMLLSHNRVLRNPTLKQEINDKNQADKFSFGFALYPVGQIADILAFKASVVPVGEDQLPHLEMTNEVARKFNSIYCDVSSDISDENQILNGGLFPVPKPLIGRVKRLIGTGGPNEKGQFNKMSKSMGNAIFLSDSPDLIKEKVMKMYTDPSRLKISDPGDVINNPLWIYHDAFNDDKQWVEDMKEKYKAGGVGDVECKKKLIECIVSLTDPMRNKRSYFEKNQSDVIEILRNGTNRANEIANKTLEEVKSYTFQKYF